MGCQCSGDFLCPETPEAKLTMRVCDNDYACDPTKSVLDRADAGHRNVDFLKANVKSCIHSIGYNGKMLIVGRDLPPHPEAAVFTTEPLYGLERLAGHEFRWRSVWNECVTELLDA